MKKIMFHLNCLERGGMERVVVNLAAKFAEDGFDTVIATEWTGEVEYPLDERVRRIHVGLNREDENKSRVGKIIVRNRNLKKCIREENPDVVLAFEKKAIYRALIETRHLPNPVVLAVRMTPYGNYEHIGDKFLINWLFPKAAGAVFQTEGMRDFFPKSIRDKSIIIVNPLNAQLLEGSKSSQREKRIVSVGRFIPCKNQLLLIKAFEKIKEKYPDYKVEFYGVASDGEAYYQSVVQYIADNNLEQQVILKGHETDVYSAIKDAELYVLSSDTEGMPNCLMEAMALGIPVIATDCEPGGARILVHDMKNGLLIPVNDENAMSEAISYMIDNREEAENMADEAIEIRKLANPDKVYQTWKEYVLKAIEDR